MHRKDFLWEPGIPAYRAMAKRLGIKPQNCLEDAALRPGPRPDFVAHAV